MPWTPWNNDLTAATPKTPLLVQDRMMRDVLAEYDPEWVCGRGAWFDRQSRMVSGVWRWRADVDNYLDQRPKGPNVQPVG